MNYYVLDAIVDSEVTLGGTSNRTDIRLLVFDTQERYIIEIKCLGRSCKKSEELSDDWANHGILQLKEYLEEEPDSKVGLLVLYDGREEDKEIKWIDEKHWHNKTDPDPMRFYLISKSASKIAKEELKKLKNQ